MSQRSKALRLVGLSLATSLGSACVYPPTSLLVLLDTDVPAERAMSVRVTARAPNSTMGAQRDWLFSTTTGQLLPASFALVPRAGGALDETVTLEVEARVAPLVLGDPPVVLRTGAQPRFVPHDPQTVRIFLSLQCASATVGCRSVSAADCTQQVLCEEQGQVCGEGGRCRTLVTNTTPFRPDAGGDSTTSDASSTSCGDGVCNGRETCSSCSADCGRCAASCGDGACNGGEDCGSCPRDCGACAPSCGNRACDGGETCTSCPQDCRACPCPSGQSRCSGTCVDTATDRNNCGACATSCPASASCRSGACQCTNTSLRLCGARCVDLQNDVANCGSCGNACASGQMCTQGRCSAVTGCRTANQNCAGDCCAGLNCGATPYGYYCSTAPCGAQGQACCHSSRCNAGLTCGGSSNPVCNPVPRCGDGTCNGTENCSTCASDCGCTSGQVCSGGSCVACRAVNQSCSGSCCAGLTCSATPYGYYCGSNACGGGGQPCCYGARCNSGYSCGPSSNPVCNAVPRCGDGTCNGTENCSTCASDCRCGASQMCSGGSCVACRAVNQTCGGNCCSGLNCNATPYGYYCGTSACGGSGQPCCYSSRCNAGLSCGGSANPVCR